MKIISRVFLFIIILVSCQDKTGPYNDLRDYPHIKNCKNVDSIIGGIMEAEYFNEKYVGIAGRYSKQYARFERLTELIDEKSMLDLTKHENPIVRAYAFRGLRLSNSKYLSEASRNLKNDTTSIRVFIGCIGGSVKISDFVSNPD